MAQVEVAGPATPEARTREGMARAGPEREAAQAAEAAGRELTAAGLRHGAMRTFLGRSSKQRREELGGRMRMKKQRMTWRVVC